MGRKESVIMRLSGRDSTHRREVTATAGRSIQSLLANRCLKLVSEPKHIYLVLQKSGSTCLSGSERLVARGYGGGAALLIATPLLIQRRLEYILFTPQNYTHFKNGERCDVDMMRRGEEITEIATALMVKPSHYYTSLNITPTLHERCDVDVMRRGEAITEIATALMVKPSHYYFFYSKTDPIRKRYVKSFIPPTPH
ncbi:hypothetical protein J6590_011872 [Homalodisca vitripennis]|nr:hypothetical protein J6590_011872 [Homalodisca vitripennis]